MTMPAEAFIDFFGTQRASAILRTPIADAARPAMEAAVQGGFRVIEFTLTIPDVYARIAEFADREDIVVGAGTVLTPSDARAAVEAGAQFLVSPVTDEAVIDEARTLGVAMMAGTFTPTEMLRAYRAGAGLQKLFPGPDAGPKYIKSVLGPMPFLKIVPTNGVHLNNAAAFLKAGAHALGFVNTLFDPNDVASGAFHRIEERATRLITAVRATVT